MTLIYGKTDEYVLDWQRGVMEHLFRWKVEPGDVLWCMSCDAEYAFDPDEPHECGR